MPWAQLHSLVCNGLGEYTKNPRGFVISDFKCGDFIPDTMSILSRPITPGRTFQLTRLYILVLVSSSLELETIDDMFSHLLEQNPSITFEVQPLDCKRGYAMCVVMDHSELHLILPKTSSNLSRSLGHISIHTNYALLPRKPFSLRPEYCDCSELVDLPESVRFPGQHAVPELFSNLYR